MDSDKLIDELMKKVGEFGRVKLDEGSNLAGGARLGAGRRDGLLRREADELREEIRSLASRIGALAGPGDAPSLTDLDALAKVYSTSYASPHHFTMGVEGLRNLLAATPNPGNGSPSSSRG